MEENTQETGLLGGTTEADFKTPDQEEDTSVNVFGDDNVKESEQSVLERPEDLPPEFWDEEKGNFKGNDLFNEYKKQKEAALNLRQKLSKGLHKPPESPESYQLNPERMAEELGHDIPENDIGLNIFKKVAFENGLGQEQFEAIFTGYMKEALSNEELQKSGQAQEMSEEQEKEYLQSEMGKLGAQAPAIIQGIKNWNQQLFYNGVFSEEDLKVAQGMGLSAAEVRVINKYRESSGNLEIPESGVSMDGMPSQQEIDKIIASPEYKTDPVLQKKVTDYFQRKYS